MENMEIVNRRPQVYTIPMPVRSFKTQDKSAKPIILIEFSGDQVKYLEQLQKHLKLNNFQDVVRVALNMLAKVSHYYPEERNDKK